MTYRNFLIIIIGVALILFGLGVDKVMTRESIKEAAAELGCTYIGSPRDLNSVALYQCGDEIKMKRIK